MRFSRSLRKTIAASLAFTMLAIPLAGCSRTVTTGGLTGKGILGDFLVGGIYGGVFGGFLRPEEPLPEGAIVLELPRVNDERLLVEAVGMDALRYYVHARIATEKLSRMNRNNSKPEEYRKLLQETATLWEYADRFADMAQTLAKRLAEKEAKPGYEPLAMIDRSPFGKEMFFSVAHAREGWGDPRSPEAAEREDRERARRLEELRKDPSRWAQEISNMYRAAPMGDKLRGLASQLGTDTKSARAELDKAMNTLNKQGISDAKLYDGGTRAAAATKGICQVSLFIGGIILSAPLLATGAAGTAMQTAIVANWYTGLADTVVEGVNDAHIVFTGDSNPGLDEAKKYTGTLSALTSGVMIATSFSNFALKGEQAVQNTHATLQAANLSTKGVLDKYNVGAEGVSAILDSSTWTVERGIEASEGKIFGFQVFDWDDGKTVVVPQEIPKADYKAPEELSRIRDDQLIRIAVHPKDLKEIFEFADKMRDAKKHMQEILEEDAKRRREIEKDEARRQAEEQAKSTPNPSPSSGDSWRWGDRPKTEEDYKKMKRQIFTDYFSKMDQRPPDQRQEGKAKQEEAPYTPSRMAGYYTVTSSKGDMAMRIVLKAKGDNTIRAIEVQQKTDKNGTGKFTITIDPKTGKGKTEQGYSVQFDIKRDGVTYMGTLEDGYRTWRFVKH